MQEQSQFKFTTAKTDIDLIAERFIEPLNDQTRKLLSPIQYMKDDRMSVDLDKDGKRFILEFYRQVGEDRRRPSYAVQRFMQRIPERKALFNVDSNLEKWQVAGTDFTAILIHCLWDSLHVTFTVDAKILYTFLLTRFLKQTQGSKIKADYKLNGMVPELPADFVDHPIKPLMRFQRVALATSLYEEGSNLWMQQGTGKTPIIIARINYEAQRTFKQEKRMYRALIVVPKNMRTNWKNKICEFAVNVGKVTVLRGGQLERIKLLVESFKPDDECQYTIVICSYEAVLRSWDALRMIEWDLCTLDESHMIKSHSTKRWIKMKDLRELCKSRTGLTGTPIANNLFDVWTQLEWLGEGCSGFTTYKSFKRYYGKFVRDESSGRDRLEGYENLPLLQERFTRLCFMITRKEAMPELPEKTYDVMEVDMSNFQRECYIKLQKQLAIEIENDLQREGNKQLTANHILTKLLRLSQITAGYLKWDAQYTDEGEEINTEGRLEYLEPNPKLEMLIEHIKSKDITEKTIVWTNWIPAIKLISKRFTEEGIKHVTYYGGTNDVDRAEAERSYNQDPEVRVFLGNPAAGGTGLDLWGYWPDWADTDKDKGTNTTQEIYYSQNWSMIHRSQSEDRAVRKFTRVSVQITDLIVPNSIDQEIALRVLNKKLSAIQLQDVKSIMEKILSNVPDVGTDDI